MGEFVTVPAAAVKEAFDFAERFIKAGKSGRDFGSNIIRQDNIRVVDAALGVIGERAFALVAKEHGIEVRFDESLRFGGDVGDNGQDIKNIIIDGEQKVLLPKLDIKTTKRGSGWLLVEKHRLQASIFVLVRADVPREKKDMGIDDIHCEISGYAFYFDFYDPLDGLPFFTYKQGMHLMKSGLSAEIVRAVTTRQERRARSKNCSREELFMDVILKCPEQVGLPISMLRGSIGSLFGMMERMAVDVEILL